jgi:hypothetical protein
MLLMLVTAVVVIGLGITVAARRQEKPKVAPPTLGELRRRAGVRSEHEGLTALLQRNTFVFVDTRPGLERRLDHRIEDAEGQEIGTVAQVPPPGRWVSNNGRPSGTVKLEIRDADETCIGHIVRPGGRFAPPFTVLDSERVPVGFVKTEGRRRAVMTDVLGRHLATIQRISRQHRVDYAIEDATGRAIGTISDLRAIAARLEGVVDRKSSYSQPHEHVLEITAPVEPDVRLLMLGAAAGVYLVLQRPASYD